MAIDPHHLAQRLAALSRMAGAYDRRSGAYAEAVGDAWLTIDPDSDGELPSANRNRAEFLGVDACYGNADRIQAIIDRFRAADVGSFFVLLSPSPRADALEEMLLRRGFEPFEGCRYPTLAHPAESAPAVDGGPKVQPISPDIDAAHRAELANLFEAEHYAAGYLETLGQPGHTHYVAVEDGAPISAAMLVTHQGLGYLLNAATRPDYRGRGGQTALIARRVNDAVAAGCDTVVAETLSILPASLRNLQRAGFNTVYDKKVFRWTEPGASTV